MSVLDDVLNSLQAMSQVQLLLAFVACTGYVLAQGSLIDGKGRRIAWACALSATLGFGLESTEWMYAAMLVSFAIAGLGLFVASAWLLSRALGFSQPRAVAEAVEFATTVESAESEFAPAHVQASPLSARTLTQHTGPAHLV